MSCEGLMRPEQIWEAFPELRYLPRPEPPPEDERDHHRWEAEYQTWQKLRCKNDKGGYFCRKHGLWITCNQIDVFDLKGQKFEGLVYEIDGTTYLERTCPPSHDQWESSRDRHILESLITHDQEQHDVHYKISMISDKVENEDEVEGLIYQSEQLHLGDDGQPESGIEAGEPSQSKRRLAGKGRSHDPKRSHKEHSSKYYDESRRRKSGGSSGTSKRHKGHGSSGSGCQH